MSRAALVLSLMIPFVQTTLDQTILDLTNLATAADVRTSGGARWYVAPGAGYRRYGYGGYGYGGGTAAGNYAQGMASVISATGEATEAVSRASINNEEARSAYIDNQKKWTETYFEKKRINEQFRDAEYAKDRQARDKYLAERTSGIPPRLTPSQLDPATGHIVWPNALRAEAFAPQRKQIEELVLLRNITSTTTDVAAQLHTAARAMQADLKGRIGTMSPNEYIPARKFLDSLAYEGNYPSG